MSPSDPDRAALARLALGELAAQADRARRLAPACLIAQADWTTAAAERLEAALTRMIDLADQAAAELADAAVRRDGGAA